MTPFHFNSQPRKEADDGVGKDKQFAINHFNSQPRKEADCVNTIFGACAQNFNSQPRKEADSQCFVTIYL